jgi:hypothetical protein
MRQSGARPPFASAMCLYRALHRLYSASELRKDTIAGRGRYAAPVVPNEPVEYCAPFSEAGERADLISAHQAAIALHICCEDRDEASADCWPRPLRRLPSSRRVVVSSRW